MPQILRDQSRVVYIPLGLSATASGHHPSHIPQRKLTTSQLPHDINLKIPRTYYTRFQLYLRYMVSRSRLQPLLSSLGQHFPPTDLLKWRSSLLVIKSPEMARQGPSLAHETCKTIPEHSIAARRPLCQRKVSHPYCKEFPNLAISGDFRSTSWQLTR